MRFKQIIPYLTLILILLIILPIITIVFIRFLDGLGESDLILKPAVISFVPNKCLNQKDTVLVVCDEEGILVMEIYVDMKQDSAFREIYQNGTRYVVVINIDEETSKSYQGYIYLDSEQNGLELITSKKINLSVDLDNKKIQFNQLDLSNVLKTPYSNIKNINVNGEYHFNINNQSDYEIK